MEINFSEDVQKALDLMNESDRVSVGIGYRAGGGHSDNPPVVGIGEGHGGLKGEVLVDNPIEEDNEINPYLLNSNDADELIAIRSQR